MKLIVFILLSLNFLHTLFAARILVFLPLAIWSHQMQYARVWEALAAKGHQVTLYSAFPPKSNLTTLKHVNIALPKIEEKKKEFDPKIFKMTQSAILGQLFLWDFGLNAAEETYQTTEFKQLMASKEEYDLVVTESFFAMESTVALGHRFKAPNVVICTFGVAPNSLNFFGSPNLPSFMPDYRTQFSDKMSFFERLENFYIVATTAVMEFVYYYPKHQYFIDNYFGKDYPSLYTMLSNVSLSLLYTNPVLAPAMPLVPNLIPVGGIHLNKPKKLPTDLQKRADAAGKAGFIYMSFGSVIDPSKLDEETKLGLLGAFRRIKLPILWKIDITNDPVINESSIPSNVFIQKWYPQTDILGHPNLRLFVTHGGISSLMETSHLGAPVLGIPFFGDQYKNLMMLRQRGYAAILPFKDLTEDTFIKGVQTILGDISYKQNAQKWAAIADDEMLPPLDRAIYWIEYVLRHKGAPHLSSQSRHLSWYVLYSLDAIGVSLVLVFVLYKLLTMCCCRRRSKEAISSRKKKN